MLETKIIKDLQFAHLGKSKNHFLFLVTILHILSYKRVTKEFLEKIKYILMFLEENATTGIYTYKNIGNQRPFKRPQAYFVIAKGYNQNIYLKFFKNNLEKNYNIVKNLRKEDALKSVTGYDRNHLESSLLTTPEHPHVFFSQFNKNTSVDSFRFNTAKANSDIIYISNTNVLTLIKDILERYIKTPGTETYTKYTLRDDFFNGGSKNKKSEKSKKNKQNQPKTKKENKYYDPNTKRYVKYETALQRNLVRK